MFSRKLMLVKKRNAHTDSSLEEWLFTSVKESLQMISVYICIKHKYLCVCIDFYSNVELGGMERVGYLCIAYGDCSWKNGIWPTPVKFHCNTHCKYSRSSLERGGTNSSFWTLHSIGPFLMSSSDRVYKIPTHPKV